MLLIVVSMFGVVARLLTGAAGMFLVAGSWTGVQERWRWLLGGFLVESLWFL